MFLALGSRRMTAIPRMTSAKRTDDRKTIDQHCFNSLMRWREQKRRTYSVTSSLRPLHCSRLPHHTTAPGNDTHHRDLISVLACLYTGCRRFAATVIGMATVNITQPLTVRSASFLLPLPCSCQPFLPSWTLTLWTHELKSAFSLRLLLTMLFCHSYWKVMNALAYRSRLIFICWLCMLKLAELFIPKSLSEIFGFCMFMRPINNCILSFRFVCLLFPFVA